MDCPGHFWKVKYMDRIDRLLLKAAPKDTPWQRLQKDNPYLGKTSLELLEYLDGDNYRAPDMGTQEWGKFMYALVHSESVGGLTE